MKAHEDWKEFIGEELKKEYYLSLISFLKSEEKNGKVIYPSKEDWFNSLYISPKEIKVIIIGQDPYHGENQAHGYSFSVKNGIKQPPSLKNIFKEIENELSIKMSSKNGDLSPWVNQGVMLLNSVLTVEKSLPGSHRNRGWETFTDKIISIISENFSEKVFMLWGNYAIEKRKIINEKKHLVLTSPHPSPFSAYTGFLGNNHFVLANKYLQEKGNNPINWEIKD